MKISLRKYLISRSILLLVFGILASACFLIFRGNHKETTPVPKGAVNLAFPFKNGEFYVLQSGPDPMFNVHMNPDEKYALDIAKTQSFWRMFLLKPGLESDPTFGTALYSPCKGAIKSVWTSSPDTPIGRRDPANPGNNVAIACDMFTVRMSHFKHNSIIVKTGDAVEIGDFLGLAGNSGNTDLPHLHIMAYRENDRGGNTPLPITFFGRYLLKGDYWPE